MKSSHPIGQEPNGLIPFSQVIAAVEKERSMIPFVNEPFGPGKRFGEGSFEVRTLGVLGLPQYEIKRHFAKCADRSFHVAGLAGRSAINKIPKRAGFNANPLPTPVNALGVQGAQSGVFLQLEQWVIGQKEQLSIVADGIR